MMKRLLLVCVLLVPMLVGAQEDDFAVRRIAVNSAAYSMTMSDDGRLLAVYELGAIHADEVIPEFLPVRVYDLDAGEERFTLQGTTDYALDAAFSSDGSVLATYHVVGWIYLWDMSDGSLIRQIPALPNQGQIEFLPDSPVLLQGAINVGSPMLLQWDTETGAITRVLNERFKSRADFDLFLDENLSIPDQALVLLPLGDGETVILSTGMDRILRWNLNTGEQVWLYENSDNRPYFSLRNLALSADEQTLVYPLAQSDTITVADAATGADATVYDFSLETLGSPGIVAIAGSDVLYITGERGEEIINIAPLDDLTSATQIELASLLDVEIQPIPFSSIAVSDDGSRIVIGGFGSPNAPDNNRVLILERE